MDQTFLEGTSAIWIKNLKPFIPSHSKIPLSGMYWFPQENKSWTHPAIKLRECSQHRFWKQWNDPDGLTWQTQESTLYTRNTILPSKWHRRSIFMEPKDIHDIFFLNDFLSVFYKLHIKHIDKAFHRRGNMWKASERAERYSFSLVIREMESQNTGTFLDSRKRELAKIKT